MLLLFLVALQSASPGEAPPVLHFPEAGLDDSAAYEGYQARMSRDSRGNTVEIYIDGKSGRIVNLWADALNESIGFTVRVGGQETTAAVAAVALGAEQATVGGDGGQDGRRWLRYSLTVPAGRSVQIGQFLLGSMRIERDFGYANRVRDPIDAPSFVPQELAAFAERADGAYRTRLIPDITWSRKVALSRTPVQWSVRASQPSLDGRNHLWLTISGDVRRSQGFLDGRVLVVRPVGNEPIALNVEIATDGAPLTPLMRDQIFNQSFLDFAARAKSRRLEREVRGLELLSSHEKLMAGLPTYATYFGRDMLMTALLMEPVWSDTMAEFVIGAALAKLGPAGDAGGWGHPGSGRASRVGYAGGRFAFDVNVVWVPAALRAIGTIDSALRALGRPGVDDAARIAQAAETWRGTARHFTVALAPAEVAARVRAKLASLPESERTHWEAVLARTGFPACSLLFPAVSSERSG